VTNDLNAQKCWFVHFAQARLDTIPDHTHYFELFEAGGAFELYSDAAAA
jgi:hypothetical protein